MWPIVDTDTMAILVLAIGIGVDDTIHFLMKLGREVRLHCDTDSSLMGGAVIRAGDLVIDGSLLGRLQRLAGVVTH